MGNAKEIVIGMKNSNMFTEALPKLDYMADVSQRIRDMYQHDIRCDNATDFLADLNRHGLIKLSTMN